MTTLFISDLHLDETRPAATTAMLDFLAGAQARGAAALYVLGDLFEAWVGDDDDAELPRRVAAGLSELRDSGVPIFFQHGNRDFLLGDDYAARSGMQLLPELFKTEIEGRSTLLIHGDSMCLNDHAYQAFRRQSRNPAWQAAMLAQPLAVRRSLAARAREESARHQSGMSAEIADVDQEAVASVLREQDVTRLIHGHTHRRAHHYFDLDGAVAERIVLGDWYESGSVLMVEDSGTRFVPIG